MEVPDDELPEDDSPPPVEYPWTVRLAGQLWFAMSVLLIVLFMVAYLVAILRGKPGGAGAACLLPLFSAFLWDGWKAARGRGRKLWTTAVASLTVGLVLVVVGGLALAIVIPRQDLFDIIYNAAICMVGGVFLVAGVLHSRGESRLPDDEVGP